MSVQLLQGELAALRVAWTRQASGCAQRPAAMAACRSSSAAQNVRQYVMSSVPSSLASADAASASRPILLGVQDTYRSRSAVWHDGGRRACASKVEPVAQPNAASTRSSGSNKRSGVFTSASGLGIFGAAAFFSKRAIMVLGGKSVWGLFKIVSIKKFIFLPAWLWLMAASGGALQPCRRPLAPRRARVSSSLALAGASAAWWFTNNRAPVTGRQQAITTTSEQEAFLGVKTLQQLLQQGLQLRPASHAAARRVQRIGDRLKHCLALLTDEPHRAYWLVRLPQANLRCSHSHCGRLMSVALMHQMCTACKSS